MWGAWHGVPTGTHGASALGILPCLTASQTWRATSCGSMDKAKSARPWYFYAMGAQQFRELGSRMGQNVGVLLRHSGAALDGVVVRRGITFAQVSGKGLKLDVYQSAVAAPGVRPCLLFIHGGAWRYGSRRTNSYMCRYFAARGFLCASPDYRLTRESPWPAQLEDCRAALGWLARNAGEFGGDGTRIGAMGTSAGAHLAALLALGAPDTLGSSPPGGSPPPVCAVCDWYGPSSLMTGEAVSARAESAVRHLLGGDPRDLLAAAAAASPLSHVSGAAPPFLIIHGTEDKVVPFEQSLILHHALRAAGAQADLIAVPGGAHGRFLATAPGVSELLDASASFLWRHLQSGPKVQT